MTNRAALLVLPLLLALTGCDRLTIDGAAVTEPARPGVTSVESAPAITHGASLPQVGQDSAMDPASAEVDASAFFQFVVHADRTYVVLDVALDGVEAIGAARVVHADAELDNLVVARALAPSPRLEVFRNMHVILRADGAVACRGVLGAPEALRWTTHYTEVGEVADAEAGWSAEPREARVVAPLEAITGDCEGAGWAHAASAPPRANFGRGPRDAALEAEALATFRASAAYQEVQQEYATVRDAGELAHDDQPARWEDYSDVSGAYAHTLVDRESQRALVLVGASASYGCGDFVGGLWMVLERVDGQLVERAVRGDQEPPEVLFDVGAGLEGLLDARRIDLLDPEGDVALETEPFQCPC